jgi:hypothetical protein
MAKKRSFLLSSRRFRRFQKVSTLAEKLFTSPLRQTNAITKIVVTKAV